MTREHFLSPLLCEYVARIATPSASDLSVELDALHVELALRVLEAESPGAISYAFSHEG